MRAPFCRRLRLLSAGVLALMSVLATTWWIRFVVTRASSYDSGQAPLITFFTTFSDDPAKRVAHENTLHLWSQLTPMVRPILYYSPRQSLAGLIPLARSLGWEVYPCPVASTTPSRLPVLRHMFLHAQETGERTPFYGYANGDIVFDDTLVTTLQALRHFANYSKQLLIVGRRTNYKMGADETIPSLVEVTRRARTGETFMGTAFDFFITKYEGYPWRAIPDFVVGRIGYDDWLVATAIDRGIPVVDATASLMALHQTGTDGDKAGWQSNVMDRFINHFLGEEFDYRTGDIRCAQLRTYRTIRNRVILRPVIRNPCTDLFLERDPKFYQVGAYLPAADIDHNGAVK